MTQRHAGKTALSYALGLIGEEASEIIKEEYKIDRFGVEDCRLTSGKSNLQHLQDELSDLMAAVRVVNLELEKQGLSPLLIDDEKAIKKKIEKIAYYGHRSLRNGTLAEPLQVMPTLSPQ